MKIKNLLNKSPDLYRALLVYRNTLIQNGCSPAELLMACGLRSNIPVDPNILITLQRINTILWRSVQCPFKKKNNNCCNTWELPQLYKGYSAYIRDLNRTSIITENFHGRSHLILTPLGTVCRYWKALLSYHINMSTGNQSSKIRCSTRVSKPVKRINLWAMKIRTFSLDYVWTCYTHLC